MLLNTLRVYLKFINLPKGLTALFAISLSLSLLLSACNQSNSTSPNVSAGVVRIGYQKFTDLDILRTQKYLEERLRPQGYSVQWASFPAGPPLLEALNANSLDIGGTGEPPPIFAQAAGANLVYISTKPPAPDTYGILLPKGSTIRGLADLKGKKVAFTKGSSAHYLIINALKSVGLKITDIQPIYLLPGDARPAFEQGKLDAWVVWDPFFQVATQTSGVRVLTTGTGGLGENRSFHLAAKAFATAHSDLIVTIQQELQKSDDWAKSHPEEVAKEYAPQLGINTATLETVTRRRPYGVLPMDDSVVAQQQAIADTFFALKLIPKQVNIKQVVWKHN